MVGWNEVGNSLSMKENFAFGKKKTIIDAAYFPELEPRWVHRAQPGVALAVPIVDAGGGGGAAEGGFDIIN